MVPPEGEPLVRVLDDHLDQEIADAWALFDSGSEDDEPDEAAGGEQCPSLAAAAACSQRVSADWV